ncbi:MAG: RsmE family RNA methyltransferase [Pseudomonadota bacterium]
MKQGQLEKKMLHWRAVAISACEQCGRNRLPEIEFQSNLDQALLCESDALKLILEFDTNTLNSQLIGKPDAVSILLGPEGGLSSDEIEFAVNQGYQKSSLGPRVLRTETAAITALALVQAKLGDSG